MILYQNKLKLKILNDFVSKNRKLNILNDFVSKNLKLKF